MSAGDVDGYDRSAHDRIDLVMRAAVQLAKRVKTLEEKMQAILDTKVLVKGE